MSNKASNKTRPAPDNLAKDRNEQYDLSGRMDRLHRRCVESLGRFTAGELRQRVDFIRRATEDLGRHADQLRGSTEELGSFSMDLYPRVLRPGEWDTIRAGVLQRAKAFGEFVRDIYGKREILHEGVIPPEIVFEDPAFHPELHGLPMEESGPILIGAVDLVRTSGGNWQVVENRFSTPTGYSYVIQIRRILAQALPELFEQMPVFPVASFAIRLSEALSDLGKTSGERSPLVVLLSEGETGRHFFEESFLARHMGIPLARTGDIVVRDRKVYLKSIRGLMRIHVIFRRLEPAQLDPVAFATGRESGIPGLIQCVRLGTVKLVNAPGCGTADNRALLAYSNRIVRYYTGEQPILQTVATYHGYDQDQVDWILDHTDDVVLKTVCHPETLERSHPEAYQLFRKGYLEKILRREPRLIVGQEIPEASRLPVFRDGQYSLEGMMMRAYFIGGRQPYVLPGGLTRLFQPQDERLPVGKRYHALKDTWALRDSRATKKRSGRLEPEISIPETPLTSRAAEAFYWIGRYLERARGTARMLNTLEELRWGELTPGERVLYKPLLDAIREATGQKLKLNSKSRDLNGLVHPLLFDGGNPASVRSCLESVGYNASNIRSFITPEFWNSIREAISLVEVPLPRRPGRTTLRTLLENLVAAGDRIYGSGHRTLLHDAGWHFLSTGIMLERAVTHVSILAMVLPRVAERQWEHLQDDTDLTALLRLLGVLDAYHRKYRSRAYLDRVVHLLWQTPACTGSILHAVDQIRTSLTSISRESADRENIQELASAISDFGDWLLNLPVAEIFPARAVELDRGLTRSNAVLSRGLEKALESLTHMREVLEGMHDRLEDTFFSHHPETGNS